MESGQQLYIDPRGCQVAFVGGFADQVWVLSDFIIPWPSRRLKFRFQTRKENYKEKSFKPQGGVSCYSLPWLHRLPSFVLVHCGN